jgi:hypothetical protein
MLRSESCARNEPDKLIEMYTMIAGVPGTSMSPKMRSMLTMRVCRTFSTTKDATQAVYGRAGLRLLSASTCRSVILHDQVHIFPLTILSRTNP